MSFDGPLWQKAASYAARAHEHQVRKDGKTPYFAHPCRVALTVSAVFGETDEQALAAALLHDVIEDGDTDFEDLADRFGEVVARIVAALSKDARLPEPEREAAYDAQLAKADWRARLIKLGDVHDNLSDLETRTVANRDAARRLVEKADRAVGLAMTCGDDRESIRVGVKLVQHLADSMRSAIA
ncbi:MAG: HD domain-containing protein [Phycisphaerales bacterium JB065]